MARRAQGDRGELSALEWVGRLGATVLVPLTHSPDYDLVADVAGRLLRVQVKTSSVLRLGRWHVSLSTRGGNRSWSGTARLFAADRCDVLFVLVADGRRWCIPAAAVSGTTGILLGGPKYAEHEVESGAPFAVDGAFEASLPAGLSLQSATPAG